MTMTYQRRILAIVGWTVVGMLVLGIYGASSAHAQGQPVQIVFSPATVNLQVGERKLVQVVVQGVPAPGLAAFQFTVRFDPAPLDVLNPNEAFRAAQIPPFAPLGGNPFCGFVRNTGFTCSDPPWFLTSTGRNPQGEIDTIDNANGRVQVAYGTSGAQNPPTGSGVIALLEVVGVANGTVVADLTDVILADNRPVPQPFPFVAGSLTVVVDAGGVQPTPPSAVSKTVTTNEGTALSITLSGSDTEPCELTFAIVTPPAHGTLSGIMNNACVAGAPNMDTASVLYTPTANYNGPDSFTYKVTDTTGFDSNVATVMLTVTAVNDKPGAEAKTVTTSEDTAPSITLSGADTETCELTFTIVTPPAHGSLGLITPRVCTPGTPNTDMASIVYTPNANYNGADSFTYKVTDTGDGAAAALDSDVVTVAITVTAVNDKPAAAAKTISIPEGTAQVATLSGADVETCDLTFTIVTPPAHGTLSVLTQNACTPGTPNADTAQITYTPTANYNGPDSFTYKVTDTGDGAAVALDSDVATVTISVTAVNTKPTAATQSVSTDEDAAKVVTLSGTDVETCELAFTIVTPPAHGTLSALTPHACTPGTPHTDRAQVTYTPQTNYNGPDSFTYKVTDSGDGAATALDSDVATVTLTITAINDKPTAAPQSVSTEEDTAKVVTLSGTDVETCNLTFTIVTPPAHGTLSVLTNVPCGAGTPNTDTATVLYTPTTHYNEPDSFSYKVTDTGDGATVALDSDVATVTLTVTAVNDKPTAEAKTSTTPEDTAQVVTLSGADVETCELSFTIMTPPAHGTLSVLSNNTCTPGTPNTDSARVTYTPTANYNGPDSFTYKVTDTGDGTAAALDSDVATVSITVTAVNDKPTAANQDVSTDEDTAKVVTLSGADVETCELTFSIVSGPLHGTLSALTNNACTPGTSNTDMAQVTYTPTANYNGPESFTFQTNDGTVDSNIATVSIMVTPVNDPPVLAPIGPQMVREGQPLVLLLTASDPEGDGCMFNAGNLPQDALFTDNKDCTATFSWTPGFSAFGNYKALFTVTDKGTPMASDFEEVMITVGNVNQPPALAPIGTQTGKEGQQLTVLLIASDPDVGTKLSFSAVSLPSGADLPPEAKLTDHGDGTATFSWLPSFADAGSYQVRFLVADDGVPSESDSEDVTIIIGNVNQPPMLTPIGAQTVDAGQMRVIPVTSSDPDKNKLTLDLTNVPGFVTLDDHGDGTGMLTLQPALGDVGVYPEATITATDDGMPALEAHVMFTITVRATGAPPTAPQDLTGRVKLLKVNLGWAGAPGATNFHVFRRLNTEMQFVKMGQTTTYAFVDNLPTGAQSAEYFVVAENAFGMSPDSATIMLMPTTRR